MKNGPALAGHGAEAVRDAITRTIITLPEELRRSLTWSAILTIAVQTPTDADRLKKNPLGVYVQALNWSKELG